MATFSDFLSARGISQVAKSSNILDATTVGRAVLTAATAAAQLSTISSGVLAVSGSNITISGQTAATQNFVASSLASFGGQTPIGGVIRYFGAIANVPANWHILDGSTVTINGQSVTLPDTRGIFTIGAGPSNAVGSTGGAASNTPTIAGTALTTDQIPNHGHGVNDPYHTHGVSDPGHAHGVADGGHNHQYGAQSGPNGSNVSQDYIGRGIQSNAYGARSTTVSGANIGIYGAGTGISINYVQAGISIQTTGGGNTHTHTSSAVPTIPPYVALYDIIRLS